MKNEELRVKNEELRGRREERLASFGLGGWILGFFWGKFLIFP
jgi:hypothetical protein